MNWIKLTTRCHGLHMLIKIPNEAHRVSIDWKQIQSNKTKPAAAAKVR